MDYKAFFQNKIHVLHAENRYRIFADIERSVGKFPRATYHKHGRQSLVTIWCSNDYMGLGHNPQIIQAVQAASLKYGAGAGGTRNISGTCPLHSQLEQELAAFHEKEAGLVFTSGYVANQTTLETLGRQIPNVIFFSDQENHASIIHGITSSRADKVIFRHNDMEHLEDELKKQDPARPKIIVFESVYSMSGDNSPIQHIVSLAKKYNALTYIDEVHGVGIYGDKGQGKAAKAGLSKEISIIQSGLGKAFGLIGGYITGDRGLVDFIRSHAPGFIFTTALPPYIIAGILKSLECIQTMETLRRRLMDNVTYLKSRLRQSGIRFLERPTHIVPILISDPEKCRMICQELLDKHQIYAQPINYPTVAKGTERIRLTATAAHTKDMIDDLVAALIQVLGSQNLLAEAA